MEAFLETITTISKLCFKGEKEKQKQGSKDVGNNNCEKIEKPKLISILTFKELLSMVKTW